MSGRRRGHSGPPPHGARVLESTRAPQPPARSQKPRNKVGSQSSRVAEDRCDPLWSPPPPRPPTPPEAGVSLTSVCVPAPSPGASGPRAPPRQWPLLLTAPLRLAPGCRLPPCPPGRGLANVHPRDWGGGNPSEEVSRRDELSRPRGQ